MSLSSYSGLKTAFRDTWMELNSSIMSDATAADIVTLAEARLNRDLGPVETNATLTGVIDSRSLDTSALSIVEPVSLFIADPSSEDERLVLQQSPAAMAYIDTSGRPTQWCEDSDDALKLNRPCDMAYAFRFRYRQRFALSDLVPTNWLLDNHPDIYFAAVMMWGATYPADTQKGFAWNELLGQELPKLKRTISRQRTGTLTLDPAVARIGRRPSFNFLTGQ